MKVATRYRYPGGSTMSVDHRFSISRNTNMERRWRMRIGQSLGQRYQLVKPIGTGGMSVVWKAIDTRLNRIVAVKIPNKGQSTDDTFRLRFEAEAHSVAGLHVTGIVTVFDYGNDIDEDGLTVSYIVMEYVEGTSLLQLLVEADILDTQQTLRVIADAADALHSAHQAGIIHRDVKPANILVRNDGTVKIVDFGIARARASLGLTTTGTVLGTISYVSPEQFGNEPITHLSDIYSLGVVAYECLAGKRPFAADTPAAIVAGHMYQQPDPLPRHVPSKVVEAINHALAKDPTQRWQSARAFAMALRSNLDPTADIAPIIRGNDLVPQPILDRNLANEDTVANTTPAPAVPTSRHRQLVYIGASIVVLLLLGSIIMNPWTSPNQLPLDTTQAAASTSPSPKPSTSPPTPTETLKESTEPPPVNDPDPDPTEIVTTQPVPLVIGMNESDARASLSNAGFNNVTMNYWDGSGSYACIVNWQNPSPQTTVTTDTFIELSVQMTTSLSKCRPWSPN